MKTPIRWRTFENAYGVAKILVVYDDDEDNFLHIVRNVTDVNGRRHDNVNRIVVGHDVPDDVVDEGISVVINAVITSSR